MNEKHKNTEAARIARSTKQIDEAIENYEQMLMHAARRLDELEARRESDPKKRELLNHFKVRLRGDMEAFANQLGLLECEKMGLES